MLLVWKGDKVVYKTSDFKDAFEFAKQISYKEGCNTYITRENDRPLYPRPKQRGLFNNDRNSRKV